MTPTDEIMEQREALLDNIQAIQEAATDLVDAVERYVKQGCLRSELLIKCKKLKELI